MTPLLPFDSQDYFAPHDGLSLAVDGALFMNYRIAQNAIVSGPFASFGGFYFSEEFTKTLKFTRAVDLLERLISTVREAHQDARSLSIRLAPSLYYEREHIEFLQAVFEYLGFSRSGDVSMLIDCKAYSPSPSLLRNVNKAVSNGLSISSASCTDCFDRLVEIKKAKNYAFGLDRDRFFGQVRTFPENYECSVAISAAGNVEACMIGINVAEGSLLFAWDQTEDGKYIRATDLLMHEAIKLAAERGHKFVDLGTVTECGELREGLVRHKEKFSSVAHIRNTYIYSLR